MFFTEVSSLKCFVDSELSTKKDKTGLLFSVFIVFNFGLMSNKTNKNKLNAFKANKKMLILELLFVL